MAPADQRCERGPLDRLAGNIKPFVGQIADARRKAEAQQLAKCKNVIREAGRIGVVLLDPKVRFVIQQAVEYMGSIAYCSTDHLGIERCVLVRDMRVEQRARLVAVLCIDLSGGPAMAASPIALPVR